jgi:hypothetical protein
MRHEDFAKTQFEDANGQHTQELFFQGKHKD